MRIESISADEKQTGLVSILLEDGRRLRAPAEEIVRLGLRAGDLLDEDTEELLLKALGSRKARKKAVNILSYRAYSQKGLQKRLVDKGIDPEDAVCSVKWLSDMGLLNDGEYARLLYESLLKKGLGAPRIRQEMSKRGLERELVESLIENNSPSGALGDYIEKKLRGRRPDKDELRKLYAALARRGHSYEDISRALRQFDFDREEDF